MGKRSNMIQSMNFTVKGVQNKKKSEKALIGFCTNTLPCTLVFLYFSYILLMQHFNKQETFGSELKDRLLVFTRNYFHIPYTIADFRITVGTPFFSGKYTRLQNLRALYTSGILQGQSSGRTETTKTLIYST